MSLSTPLKSLFVVAGITLAANATAGSQDNEYGVSFKASELASSQGVSSVHARIVAEAKNYCPKYRKGGSLSEVKLCLQDVTSDLVSQINHPMLSKYHAGEGDVEIARVAGAEESDRS